MTDPLQILHQFHLVSPHRATTARYRSNLSSQGKCKALPPYAPCPPLCVSAGQNILCPQCQVVGYFLTYLEPSQQRPKYLL